MANFLRQASITSDLANVQSLLSQLPEEDLLGRMSLSARAYELTTALSDEQEGVNTLASVALYFGGKPVIGSQGIEAGFASTAIADFRDVVVMMWAAEDSVVGARGPVKDQDAARLHVTQLLHGSMGFLLQEIEPRAVPLFPTPLKKATDQASDIILRLARASDEEFEEQIESLQARVFSSVQRLFKDLNRAEANFRIVDQENDILLSQVVINHATVRLEATSIDENRIEESGTLLGIIPNAGRFEFRSNSGDLRTGSVSTALSESYLRRIEENQAVRSAFKAVFLKKRVTRFGRSTERFTLLDLHELGSSSLS